MIHKATTLYTNSIEFEYNFELTVKQSSGLGLVGTIADEDFESAPSESDSAAFASASAAAAAATSEALSEQKKTRRPPSEVDLRFNPVRWLSALNSGDSTELAPGRIAGVRWWARETVEEEKSFNIEGDLGRKFTDLRLFTPCLWGKKPLESEEGEEGWRRRWCVGSKPFINLEEEKRENNHFCLALKLRRFRSFKKTRRFGN